MQFVQLVNVYDNIDLKTGKLKAYLLLDEFILFLGSGSIVRSNTKWAKYGGLSSHRPGFKSRPEHHYFGINPY